MSGAIGVAGPTNPDWHPWMPNAIAVTSYEECQEILVTRAFEVFCCSPGS